MIVSLTMLIVGAKATQFRNWHLLLAAFYGLIGRGLGMRIAGAIKNKGKPAAGHGHAAHGAAHAATKPEMVEA